MWPQSAMILLLALAGTGCAGMDNSWYPDSHGPHHGYYDSWYSPAPAYYSSTYYVVRPPRYAPPPAHHRPPAPPQRHEYHGDRDGRHGGPRPDMHHNQPPRAQHGGSRPGPGPQHADSQPRPDRSPQPGFHSQEPRPGR